MSPNPVRAASPTESARRRAVPVRDFSLVIALAVVWAFFAAMAPEFLGARNLSMLVIELSVTATLALGMLLVLLPGQIDLSAGSGVGLIGGIASVLVFHHQWPALAALAAGSVVGVLLWGAMGRLIIRERIPAFIITLGGLLVFKGLFWLVIRNATVPVAPGGSTNLYSALTTYYLPQLPALCLAGLAVLGLVLAKVRDRRERRRLGLTVEEGELSFLKLFTAAQGILLFVLLTCQFRGVPLPALLLAAVALGVHAITRHTVFGRHLYAVGGNEEAAFVAGVPVARVVTLAFACMGGIVALTGFLQTAYSGASTTTVGDLMELDAIAACVVGGTSLRGGRGSVLGVLFGALLMASLMNGMTLLAVSPELKFMVRGLVLALAVWMDVRLNRA